MDFVAQNAIGGNVIFNFVAGVDDGGVVAAAKLLADLRERGVRELT